MSRFIASSFVAALAGVSGCVTPGTTMSTMTAMRPFHRTAPVGNPQQVHAAWENKIVITQDVVNGGRPLVGLAGRLYVMEDFGVCLKTPGTALVELYDATNANAETQPKMIERFELDRDTLKRLASKDDIGWGYTVFLPWSTYRPEIKRVQLQVKWMPENGQPLYSAQALVPLYGERQHQMTASQRRVAATEVANSGVFGPPPPASPQPTRQ